MTERRGWLTVQGYMTRYSVSRTYLYKLAACRLVTLKRITLPGRTKPKVWVEDAPPRADSDTS